MKMLGRSLSAALLPFSGKKLMQEYLNPTAIIDADHESIIDTANRIAGSITDEVEKASALFYFVRDNIDYNMYVSRMTPEDFTASATLARGNGFCIQKAVLLAALCRASGIPARLGFAVIRNHMIPEKLFKLIGTKEIPDHGYVEIFLGEQWLKATPAFDINTCRENRIRPVEFDGKSPAPFHKYNEDGLLHIEYVLERGKYSDLPFDDIAEWVAPLVTPELLAAFGGEEG